MSTIAQLQQTLNVSTIGYVSVVAQQYSSFAFLSLHFYLRKEKIDVCFKYLFISSFIHLKSLSQMLSNLNLVIRGASVI